MGREVFDHTGRAVRLGTELGRGGEGAVYNVDVSKDYVAKIYSKQTTREKAEKLSLMLRLNDKSLQTIAAWPVATLHDRPGGMTVGLVMPKISSPTEIHELYSPAHRKIEFPSSDWRFLVRTALNCAAAFESLHAKNIVIADVNQGNILVSKRATVSLIDCDSFQIESNNRTVYKCKVGVAHFTPPEVSSYDIVRTTNHDNFGLAVMVFHLLFMGRHPFSGRFTGNGDMPLEKAIKENRFAYGRSASRFQMAPPPHSLLLQEVNPEILRMFEGAFSDPMSGYARPTASDWRKALVSLESRTTRCKKDPGHYYYKGAQCPWCRITQGGGPNFFISVSIKSASKNNTNFNLQRVWLNIRQVPKPGQNIAGVQMTRPSSLRARPIPEHMYNSFAHNTSVRNRLYKKIGTGLFFFLVLVYLFEFSFVGSLFSISTILLVYSWSLRDTDAKAELARRKGVAINLKEELELTKGSLTEHREKYKRLFENKYRELSDCRSQYEHLDKEKSIEYRDLQIKARDIQLQVYLERCFISRARIPGIGPSRIVTLESHGIETAADVIYERVKAISGFGPELSSSMVTWRKNEEARFRFDPSKGVPASAVQTLDMKYLQLKNRLQTLLTIGASELRRVTDTANGQTGKLNEKIAQLDLQVTQAELDASYTRQ